MKKFLVLMLILAVSLGAVVGCAQEEAAEEPAEEPAAEEPAAEEPAAEEADVIWTIDVNGTPFTSADYAALGEVEITATKKSKDGTETPQTWKGVYLKDVLAAAGAQGYSLVTVEASDGYAKDIDDMSLVESEGTILGTVVDGEALGAEDGYVQLVMDGKGSNWWIKSVAKITAE